MNTVNSFEVIYRKIYSVKSDIKLAYALALLPNKQEGFIILFDEKDKCMNIYYVLHSILRTLIYYSHTLLFMYLL